MMRFEIGHSRQEVLHPGQEVSRIEAGFGRTGRSNGMVQARTCKAKRHQQLLTHGWSGLRAACSTRVQLFTHPQQDCWFCCKVRFLRVESKSGYKDSKGLRMPTSSKN